ncbi:hypothetical protein F5888DRAFT_1804482 [Russula emetica]|nr:hypothetical protein F5888DRAFT_1804482 [Russula emetica]
MDSTGGPNDDLDSVAGASPAQSSRQLSRRAEPRPTEIQTITVPGVTIRGHQATAELRDASQYGVELDAQSQTYQPSSKQQSTSTSPLQSLPAPEIAKTTSSRMHTPRNTLPYELQAPSSGTPFESPHPPGEDRGKARPKEVGHKDHSAPPHGLTAPPEYIPSTTKLPSRQDYNYPSAAPHTPLPRPGPSTRISNEAHDVSVTAQPIPLMLHHPLYAQAQCASPRYGLPLEYGQPPPGIREMFFSEEEKEVKNQDVDRQKNVDRHHLDYEDHPRRKKTERVFVPVAGDAVEIPSPLFLWTFGALPGWFQQLQMLQSAWAAWQCKLRTWVL